MSWKRFKFGNHKVYIVPGNPHKFRTEHDAKYYCQQNNIDWSEVEIYDSDKEHNRWLELQLLEKTGEIVNLRRQVEYELIPAHYEMIFVKEKTVKQWLVYTEDSLGKTFDTKKEAIEYCKSAGLKQKDIGCITRTKPVYKNVCIEQNAVYTADFVYYENGQLVVEDVKSEATRKEKDYVLRRKMMLHLLGIRIKET